MRKQQSPRRVLLVAVTVLICSWAPVGVAEVNDPWEGLNRKIFAFNDAIDRWLMKPLARGYRAVAPEFVETGISNVFDNLLEITNIVNDVMQGKFSQAGSDSGRFLINTTIGIAGFFDVAQHLGLAENIGEDFGQTLASWGVGQGPFLMLPLLGPSTVRATVGWPVNSVLNPIRYIDHVPTRNSVYGSDLVETRAGLLDAEKLISGDKYTYLRDAYLQRREFLLNDGAVKDDFESDFEF